MKNELTFDKVVDRLVDGLTYNENEMYMIRHWLMNYQKKNHLSLQQLDDLCFNDSVWVFDHIFACNDNDYDKRSTEDIKRRILKMKMINKGLELTNTLGNIVENSEEMVYANYVINVGNSWVNLEPVDSAYTKEEAITKAKRTGARCQEVVYSPADDQNYPDKVVWRNRSVTYKCCHYCGKGVCEIPVYQECDGKDYYCPEFKDIYDKEV